MHVECMKPATFGQLAQQRHQEVRKCVLQAELPDKSGRLGQAQRLDMRTCIRSSSGQLGQLRQVAEAAADSAWCRSSGGASSWPQLEHFVDASSKSVHVQL